MKYRLLTLAALLLFSIQAMVAQSLNVEGTVIDQDGETVIGATISVKGSKTNAVTDFDGKFTLKNLKNSDVLIVSYIGMKTQEVKVKSRLTIQLESEAQQLEQVLVVAFGQQKRSSFTGSAAVVDSKQLELRQVTNAVSALDGQVAGLQMVSNSGSPDATPTLLIRGISSIYSGTEPLIIVDGAPYDGDWNDINPADVESMTVLKDAASNALYGARGANGVIMITTKQAGKGDAKISLDAKWGINSRGSQLYETIDNPALYYETHYRALYNYYNDAMGYTPYQSHVLANSTMGENSSVGGLGYIAYTVPNGEYLIGENGKLNPNASLGNRVYNNGNFYTIIPDDWMDEAYRTALRQEYNLNINGGNEKATFYASLGYLKNEGIVSGADYERYTARMKASYQAKDWLKIGGNINYAHSVSNSVFDQYYDAGSTTNLFYQLVTMAPIYPVYLRDGSGKIMVDQNGRMYDYGDGAVNGIVRPVNSNTNMLQDNMLNTNNSNGNTWTLNGFTDITPLDGLKITFNGSATDNEYRTTNTTAPFYGYGNMVYPGGFVSKLQYRTLSYNFQQLINYVRSFGKHNMTLLLGHENYNRTYQYVSGSKKNMASYWENQELDGAVSTISTNSQQTDYNTEGYFFRGMYDYDDKYHANISFRRDASSRFHPDHRWGSFYAFGGAWVMNKEKWMNEISWINSLKLKASFGQQGNDAIDNFLYTDTYTIGNLNGEVAMTFNTKGNPDITWETNTNINAGVEFDLFHGRLSGGVEYFYRKTTDMLNHVATPTSSGYKYYWANIGDMVNQGIEIDLHGTIVKTKDFTWSANINATHYRNKVTYLNDSNKGSTAIDRDGKEYFGGLLGNYFICEDMPRYTWYMYDYLGVNDKGEAVYFSERTEDGTTTIVGNATRVLCGSPTPDLYGGFGTQISYKGFDLGVNFGYSIGGKVYDRGYQTLMALPKDGATGSAFHKDILNSWTPENPNSCIPHLQYNDLNTNDRSSRWLIDGSYLSLQSVNISYTFPKKLVKHIQLNNLRAYVSAENLWFWSKRQGMDPRSVDGFNGYISPSNYSVTRTITAGVSLNF